LGFIAAGELDRQAQKNEVSVMNLDNAMVEFVEKWTSGDNS
jgi:hypothetical protein